MKQNKHTNSLITLKLVYFVAGICPDLPWFYQKREAEPINAFHAVDPVHDW